MECLAITFAGTNDVQIRENVSTIKHIITATEKHDPMVEDQLRVLLIAKEILYERGCLHEGKSNAQNSARMASATLFNI